MTELFESVERVPLACILLLIVTVQSAIANTTLPDETAEALLSMFSVAGIEFGIFSALLLMILFWVLIPIFNYCIERAYAWQSGRTAGGEPDEA